MNDLERRYRRLMAAYPRIHRREWEDEIVSTLLENAKPSQTRPSFAESWDLLSSAMATRLRVGKSERRSGRLLAGRVALGSASAVVSLVLTLQLFGISQADNPFVFALLWVPFVALIIATPFRTGRFHRIGVPLLVGWSTVAVIAGPEYTMAQRTLTAAVVLLLVVAVLSPADGKRIAGRSRTVAIIVIAGVTVGIALALRIDVNFEYQRGRGAVVMWDALPHPPPISVPFIVTLAVLAIVAAASRPSWSTALGLLLLPIGTVVHILSSAAFFFTPTAGIIFRTAGAIALALILIGGGTLRSMSGGLDHATSEHRKTN